MPGRLAIALVHARGPEAALAVAFAVVEAVVGQAGFRTQEGGCGNTLRVDQGKARAQCSDEATALAQYYGTDRLRHRCYARRLLRDVMSEQARRLDVDPVERALGRRPQRRFTEHRVGADGE